MYIYEKHNWPNFISDIVTASKQNEALCTNNMHILQLLRYIIMLIVYYYIFTSFNHVFFIYFCIFVYSEEVFDYSANDMTQEKMRDMKNQLSKEFGKIFDLCFYILVYLVALWSGGENRKYFYGNFL